MPETFFEKGVAVPEVNKNSPAAAAGLKRGDIILKVQNLEVPANPAAVPGVVRYITCAPPALSSACVPHRCLPFQTCVDQSVSCCHLDEAPAVLPIKARTGFQRKEPPLALLWGHGSPCRHSHVRAH